METLRLSMADTIAAESVLTRGTPPTLQRRWYRIVCDAGWRVRAVEAGSSEGSSELVLSARDGEWWSGDGRRLPSLSGCIDVDISLTPFTNTLPVRRLGLKHGDSQTIEVAYVDLEAMSVRPAWQRYTCIRASASGGIYRYESLASGSAVELPVDADRLVVDYPGLFHRLDCPDP